MMECSMETAMEEMHVIDENDKARKAQVRSVVGRLGLYWSADSFSVGDMCDAIIA